MNEHTPSSDPAVPTSGNLPQEEYIAEDMLTSGLFITAKNIFRNHMVIDRETIK